MQKSIKAAVGASGSSVESESGIRDALSVLDKEEHKLMAALSKTQEKLASIQSQRRLLIDKLLDGDDIRQDAQGSTLRNAGLADYTKEDLERELSSRRKPIIEGFIKILSAKKKRSTRGKVRRKRPSSRS